MQQQDDDAAPGSLAELAQLAGVSASTVSRALAGSELVNAKTREKIQRLAAEHGFQPNMLARNLRLKRTQAVAVVLPLGHATGQHLSDPFFITLLGHLADALTERGYDLLLSRVIPTNDLWLDQITGSGRVDGVIVIGQSDQIDVLDRVAARYPPMVVWGSALPGHRHTTVGTDNRAGGMLATRHLIDTGRRNLLFLGNVAAPEIAEREAGFRAAVAECPDTRAQVLPVEFTPEESYAGIADYLALHAPPDGIFAASDVVAMSAIRVLAEQRLRVPEDVAVVGFDDVPLASHTTPPLTTVRQQVQRGATLMVEMLMRRMAGEAVGSISLPPEIVIRRSTVPQEPMVALP